MPFRLGMPERKFIVKMFDSSLLDEMPPELCYVYYLWYGKTPEEILERAEVFISASNGEVDLLTITEVLWECDLYD